jgi:5-formyltetrahydrofolate cyclo-ligase
MEKSVQIMEKFLALDCVKEASVIYLYVNHGTEVITKPLIEQLLKSGKRIGVPKVYGEKMEFIEIKNLMECIPGYKGILEPASDQIISEIQDVLVMPGVGFYEACNRLGYGRGYYDRYLLRLPVVETVAFSFECQIYSSIPSETFDIRPHTILTEKRTIYNEIVK